MPKVVCLQWAKVQFFAISVLYAKKNLKLLRKTTLLVCIFVLQYQSEQNSNGKSAWRNTQEAEGAPLLRE